MNPSVFGPWMGGMGKTHPRSPAQRAHHQVVIKGNAAPWRPLLGIILFILIQSLSAGSSCWFLWRMDRPFLVGIIAQQIAINRVKSLYEFNFVCASEIVTAGRAETTGFRELFPEDVVVI